jgi:polyhydroxyalkanoate synthesis regulator phasin
MEEFIRKIINTSMGAALLAKDKIKELIDELVNNGKLTEEEGRQFMDDLRKDTNQKRENMESEVKSIVERMLEKMDIATRKDLKKLEKRIAYLEKENMSS